MRILDSDEDPRCGDPPQSAKEPSLFGPWPSSLFLHIPLFPMSTLLLSDHKIAHLR